MEYKFNYQTFQFDKINTNKRKLLNITIISVLVITIILLVSRPAGIKKVYKFIAGESVVVTITSHTPFSSKNLKLYLKQINIKHPHIVYAQAKLESGGFKSNIFKENNNLFGMKKAFSRPTTSVGVNSSHAVYNTWQESVLDYAIYQAKYLSDLKTEAQYLDYLKSNYAEDPNYYTKLLKMCKDGNSN